MGFISMMSAYAVRAPAPEVYQFTAFPINLILLHKRSCVSNPRLPHLDAEYSLS